MGKKQVNAEGRLLLSAAQIRQSYGDRTVLNIDHLHIYDGQRIGLIGENGAGKSTLLAILAGETEPDGGDIQRYGKIAYIHQVGQTEREADRAMQSVFRAPELRDGLSGGEETRRRIAAALSSGSALLLADEPGTDLDSEGLALLRRHLGEWPGALVMVSHDRALLEDLCNIIWHLEDGKVTVFPGTYSAYQEELQRRRDYQQFEYDQYRAEKKRLKAAMQQKREWAASVQKAPKRMGNSEARLHTHEYTNSVLQLSHASQTLQNRIDRLEKKERPRDLPEIRMKLGANRPIRARNALEVRCDALTAGSRLLLADTGFVLPAGSRTALTGLNGSGKTTLLRAVLDKLPAEVSFSGEIRLNPAARISCFDQDHARSLNLNATVLENAMADSVASEADARTVLARLNLRGDAVFKAIRVLSGGERAKVALARVLLSDSNLLVLDEPTNHLDLFTMEALQELLADYGGTLLFVSHDETLVRAVASRILRLEREQIVPFEGTLDRMRAEEARDRSQEKLKMEITRLEMQMASLTARLSAPRKGDHPEQLNAELDALSEQLREARNAL